MSEAVIARVRAELTESIAGSVRFDAGSRALYASDASNYRHVPIGVVEPRSREDVETTVAICHRHGIPILPRGAGTSLCGQVCNVAVVIDFTPHLNRILALDPVQRTATVEPGLVLDSLRERAAEHGLTFAPDPATHSHNTLGGMIGNNSCGPHSLLGGTTMDNVLSLLILTSDGLRLRVGPTTTDQYQQILREGGRRAEIYRGLWQLANEAADEIRSRFPTLRRRVSGFNLQALLPENGFNLAQALVGTEGTCVTVLEATVRLLPRDPARKLLVLGFDSICAAGDRVSEIRQHAPGAIEGIDARLIDDVRRSGLHRDDLDLLPAGKGWLLVEFAGPDAPAAQAKAQRLMDALATGHSAPSMRLFDDPEPAGQLWSVREAGLGATAHVPGRALTWEGWEDSAVPVQRLGEYLRALRSLLDEHGYQGDFYGHFGEGCVHTRIDFELTTSSGVAQFRRFIEAAARLVVSFGGSISGEHGDGQSKAELLPLMYGQEMVDRFRHFKAIWDPQGLMNPGRVVDPRPLDQDLRLGPSYRPVELETRLHFPEDEEDFARATLRCVGVGACRKHAKTMCPSFMATGDETHSTRGRAHLLHEMASGRLLEHGWRQPEVERTLDLCLSCKACKRECPVSVDMAVYKAEFMHQYHRSVRRPLHAHVFGRIDRWARLASVAPALSNRLAASRPGRWLARRLLAVAEQRTLPRFARRSFQAEGRARASARTERKGRHLILWPDTFTNHFQPEVGHAAARVLEACGWTVQVPQAALCCGRPLYEYGLLDEAEQHLRKIIAHLSAAIEQETPIVVLEPACRSVFDDELLRLLPADQQARRLQKLVVGFDAFVAEHWPLADAGGRNGRVLHHPHCHQRAGDDAAHAPRLLQALGFDVECPDSGCCGMAGAFGYHVDHYEVSMRCAERVLLPAIRSTAPATTVVSAGFSCRQQIEHGSGHQALHLAQLLERLIDDRRIQA